MSAPLTDRQVEVLAYIAAHRREHGHAPTVRDLMARFGWASTNSAATHLKALKKKGALDWTRTLARTVSLTALGERALRAGRAA